MTIVVISMIRQPWGGSEELWYQMALYALKQGHKVIHYAYETPEPYTKTIELKQLGLEERYRPGWIPAEAGKSKKLFYLGKNYIRKRIRNPFSKLLSDKPDVILYNGTCYSICQEFQLLSVLRHNSMSLVPFFLLGHLNHDLERGISDSQADLVRWAYNKSRRVLFVSERSRENAERHLCSRLSNALLVRNPVNMQEVGVLPFPNQEKINFATVGNLVTEHKGQDILLSALSREHWRGLPWILNIYGSGQDEAYLKALTKYYQLEEKVQFHGKVNDIRSVWKTNHLLLMPSHMEGMPLAVVEAMLCGRPCLATDVGGHKEWIDNGKNGFIVEGSNVDAIDKAMIHAWENRANWREMGQLAFEKAGMLYEKEAGKKLFEILCKD